MRNDFWISPWPRPVRRSQATPPLFCGARGLVCASASRAGCWHALCYARWALPLLGACFVPLQRVVYHKTGAFVKPRGHISCRGARIVPSACAASGMTVS